VQRGPARLPRRAAAAQAAPLQHLQLAAVLRVRAPARLLRCRAAGCGIGARCLVRLACSPGSICPLLSGACMHCCGLKG
jgi:hypothetical protein